MQSGQMLSNNDDKRGWQRCCKILVVHVPKRCRLSKHLYTITSNFGWKEWCWFWKMSHGLRCPFCGLGFAPMWVGKMTSCKHVYIIVGVNIHFNILFKCIQPSCKEDMHEAWWKSLEINKPSTIVILDHILPKDFGSRPKFLPFHKPTTKGRTNSILLSSFVVIEFC